MTGHDAYAQGGHPDGLLGGPGGGHPGGPGGGHPTGVGHPGGPGGGHPNGVGHPAGPDGHPNERFARQYDAGAPWDIGRPQPELVALSDSGVIGIGRVLDVGCGRGDNALMLAERGATVVGIDGVPAALATARGAAEERGLTARAMFLEGDVLDTMPSAEGPFDTVIDCGFFHALSDEARMRFADLLADALTPGGVYVMLCFSERVPAGFGPRRVSAEEIRATFAAPRFTVREIRPAALHSAVPHMPVVDANLAVIERAE